MNEPTGAPGLPRIHNSFRQVHFWALASEIAAARALAVQRDQTLSAFIRAAVRHQLKMIATNQTPER